MFLADFKPNVNIFCPSLSCCRRDNAEESQSRIAGIFEAVLFTAGHKYRIIGVKWILFPFVNENALTLDYIYFMFVRMSM